MLLLGVGDDAHTASIFPQTDLVHNSEATVASVWVEKLNTFRISLTAPLINQAKHVAFITFGANKAEALEQVWRDEKRGIEVPFTINRSHTWRIAVVGDEAATAFLRE